MGGLHFSLTLLWSQLTTIGSAVLYERYYEPPGGDSSRKASPRVLYTLVGSLAVTWLVFFVLFLLLINREYVSTLLSAKTGKQHTIDSFQKGDDFQKQDVFTANRRHWSSIRDEVKQFTHDNWAKWMQEETKPEWFDDEFVRRVPDEFIPKELIEKSRMTTAKKMDDDGQR